jgi:hypothetical protein
MNMDAHERQEFTANLDAAERGSIAAWQRVRVALERWVRVSKELVIQAFQLMLELGVERVLVVSAAWAAARGLGDPRAMAEGIARPNGIPAPA